MELSQNQMKQTFYHEDRTQLQQSKGAKRIQFDLNEESPGRNRNQVSQDDELYNSGGQTQGATRNIPVKKVDLENDDYSQAAQAVKSSSKKKKKRTRKSPNEKEVDQLQDDYQDVLMQQQQRQVQAQPQANAQHQAQYSRQKAAEMSAERNLRNSFNNSLDPDPFGENLNSNPFSAEKAAEDDLDKDLRDDMSNNAFGNDPFENIYEKDRLKTVQPTKYKAQSIMDYSQPSRNPYLRNDPHAFTAFPEMKPLRSRSRDKSTDPILWPAGAPIPTRPYGSHFRTVRDDVNFNAVDFLRREKEKEPNHSSIIELEARQKIFEEVIIERVKQLQNQLQNTRSSFKKMGRSTSPQPNWRLLSQQVQQEMKMNLQGSKTQLFLDLKQQLFKDLNQQLKTHTDDQIINQVQDQMQVQVNELNANIGAMVSKNSAKIEKNENYIQEMIKKMNEQFGLAIEQQISAKMDQIEERNQQHIESRIDQSNQQMESHINENNQSIQNKLNQTKLKSSPKQAENTGISNEQSQALFQEIGNARYELNTQIKQLASQMNLLGNNKMVEELAQRLAKIEDGQGNRREPAGVEELNERLTQVEDRFLKHKNLADATMDYLNNSIQEHSKIASEEKKSLVEQLLEVKSQTVARKPKLDAGAEERINSQISIFQKDVVKADVFKKQMADMNKRITEAQCDIQQESQRRVEHDGAQFKMDKDGQKDLNTRIEKLEGSYKTKFKKLEKLVESFRNQEIKLENLVERVNEIENSYQRRNVTKKAFVVKDAYDENAVRTIEESAREPEIDESIEQVTMKRTKDNKRAVEVRSIRKTTKKNAQEKSKSPTNEPPSAIKKGKNLAGFEESPIENIDDQAQAMDRVIGKPQLQQVRQDSEYASFAGSNVATIAQPMKQVSALQAQWYGDVDNQQAVLNQQLQGQQLANESQRKQYASGQLEGVKSQFEDEKMIVNMPSNDHLPMMDQPNLAMQNQQLGKGKGKGRKQIVQNLIEYDEKYDKPQRDKSAENLHDDLASFNQQLDDINNQKKSKRENSFSDKQMKNSMKDSMKDSSLKPSKEQLQLQAEIGLQQPESYQQLEEINEIQQYPEALQPMQYEVVQQSHEIIEPQLEEYEDPNAGFQQQQMFEPPEEVFDNANVEPVTRMKIKDHMQRDNMNNNLIEQEDDDNDFVGQFNQQQVINQPSVQQLSLLEEQPVAAEEVVEEFQQAQKKKLKGTAVRSLRKNPKKQQLQDQMRLQVETAPPVPVDLSPIQPAGSLQLNEKSMSQLSQNFNDYAGNEKEQLSPNPIALQFVQQHGKGLQMCNMNYGDMNSDYYQVENQNMRVNDHDDSLGFFNDNQIDLDENARIRQSMPESYQHEQMQQQSEDFNDNNRIRQSIGQSYKESSEQERMQDLNMNMQYSNAANQQKSSNKNNLTNLQSLNMQYSDSFQVGTADQRNGNPNTFQQPQTLQTNDGEMEQMQNFKQSPEVNSFNLGAHQKQTRKGNNQLFQNDQQLDDFNHQLFPVDIDSPPAGGGGVNMGENDDLNHLKFDLTNNSPDQNQMHDDDLSKEFDNFQNLPLNQVNQGMEPLDQNNMANMLMGDFSNDLEDNQLVDNDFIDQLDNLNNIDNTQDNFGKTHSRSKQMELTDAIRDANIETQPRSTTKINFDDNVLNTNQRISFGSPNEENLGKKHKSYGGDGNFFSPPQQKEREKLRQKYAEPQEKQYQTQQQENRSQSKSNKSFGGSKNNKTKGNSTVKIAGRKPLSLQQLGDD